MACEFVEHPMARSGYALQVLLRSSRLFTNDEKKHKERRKERISDREEKARTTCLIIHIHIETRRLEKAKEEPEYDE